MGSIDIMLNSIMLLITKYFANNKILKVVDTSGAGVV